MTAEGVAARKLVVGLMTLVACAAVVSTVLPAYGQELAETQVLRVGLPSGDVLTLDPHFSTRVGEAEIVRAIYEGLVSFPPGEINMEKIGPGLAERWQVSNDGTVYTFFLRRGVQWHKGYGELTAEDVRFSLERVMDPEVGSPWREQLANVESVRVVDKYTVRIILKRPDPFFLGRVANINAGYIVSKRAVQEFGKNIALNPVGTGPFYLERYVPRQEVALRSNANYYGGRPTLDRVVYLFMPDISSRFLALASGELDVAALPYEQQWVDRARELGLKVDLTTPGNAYTIHYNMKVKPLDDVRVRQALSYAINRAEIIAFSGKDIAEPVLSPVPQGYFGHTTEGLPLYPYDPNRAKALLAEAGYPKGFHLGRVYMSESDIYLPIFQIIQEQWKRVGVTMELTVVDHPTYHKLIREDANPVVLYAAYRIPPTAHEYLSQFYAASAAIGKPTAITNFSHYGEVVPGIDEYLEKASATRDPEEQKRLYAEAQRKIMRDVPAYPIMMRRYVMARQPYVDIGHEQKSYSLYDVEVRTRILNH